jgi:isopentenyl-diphosphate delta-isomerase
MLQEVLLVDERDVPVGTAEKMDAHRKGLLHRAFSVFIFDNAGRMLLQKRAKEKYHGGDLWTNACCSHPSVNDEIKNSAEARLQEELGFTTSLQKIFEFKYRAEVENDLIEHEYDHVFAGEYNGAIHPNTNEVSDYCYKEISEIKKSLTDNPSQFTFWFKMAFPKVEHWWQQQYSSR